MKECRKFTCQEVDTLASLCNDHTAQEIGHILGRSHRVINNKLKLLGLIDKSQYCTILQKRTWKKYEDIYSMPIADLLFHMYWVSKLPLSSIGEMFTVSTGTIMNWMKALEIPRRSNEEAQLTRYSKMSKQQKRDCIASARAAHRRVCEMVNTENRRFKRDENWLIISDRVKTRDGYKCTQCGMEEKESYNTFGNALCVHHVIPYHICRKHEVSNLVSLCSACHLRIHRKYWWDEVREQKKLLELKV